MDSRREAALGRLRIVGAAALWSTAGLGIKLSTLDAWGVAGGRSIVAAAMLFLISRTTRVWPTLRVLGVAGAYAATVLLFVLATKLTTAANAIFLQDTAPIYVLALGPLLLKERPSRSELQAVPVYLLGIALFFLDQVSPGQARGNVLALLSGVSFAFLIVGLRGVREGSLAAVAWGNLLAAVIALPLAVGGPVPTGVDLLWLSFLGVFQLGAAYFLFARGVKTTPAVETSLLVLLEPVLNPIWVFLATGERPGPWSMAGGAIILIATAWRAVEPMVSRRGARST